MAFRINNQVKIVDNNATSVREDIFSLNPITNITYKYKYNPTNIYLTQLVSMLNKYEYSRSQISFDSVNNEWIIQQE
jgi:hypothetical protein